MGLGLYSLYFRDKLKMGKKKKGVNEKWYSFIFYLFLDKLYSRTYITSTLRFLISHYPQGLQIGLKHV